VDRRLIERLQACRLARRFYARPHTVVAEELIGKVVWRLCDEGLVAARIVETEAYGGSDDPGSHGYRGQTPRNATMFGPPGHAYVYFTYGMHHCLNVVTGRDGECSAVLIRAGEPLYGVELMRLWRRSEDIYNLASGPGKLTQALGVSRSDDGTDLCSSVIGISDDGFEPESISESPRIGLSQDGGHLWRYCYEGNRFVSKPWPWRNSAYHLSRVESRPKG
jgi:DNA-3-methyladenine glycosylase